MKPVELDFENETKRTFRFDDKKGTSPISTLYIAKGAFEQQPKKIRVSIEVIE